MILMIYVATCRVLLWRRPSAKGTFQEPLFSSCLFKVLLGRTFAPHAPVQVSTSTSPPMLRAQKNTRGGDSLKWVGYRDINLVKNIGICRRFFTNYGVGLYSPPSIFFSLFRSFALSRQPTPWQTPAGGRLQRQQIRPAAAARGTVALQLPQRPLTATQRWRAAQMVPLPHRRYLAAAAGRRPSAEAHPPPPQVRQTLLPPLQKHREAGVAEAPEHQRPRQRRRRARWQRMAGRAAGTILWWVRQLEAVVRSAVIPTL